MRRIREHRNKLGPAVLMGFIGMALVVSGLVVPGVTLIAAGLILGYRIVTRGGPPPAPPE